MSDEDDWDSLEWQFGHAVSDAYKKGRKSMQAERDAAISRAEAAEAQVAKLREALGRFAATSERVNAAMMQPPDDDHDFTPDRGRTIVGLLKELLVEMGQHARAALEPAHD